MSGPQRRASASLIVVSQPGRRIEVMSEDNGGRVLLSDVQAQVLAEDLLPAAILHARMPGVAE